MSMNDVYQPINCDDYDNLELACQNNWVLTLKMRGLNDESFEARAKTLLMQKNVEYLIVDRKGEELQYRLDWIESFSNPEIGTVVVSVE